MKELQDKRVLVVGLGRSGIAAANLLYKLGARVEITDLRREEELQAELSLLKGEFEFHLGGHGGIDIHRVDRAVVSPGVWWGAEFLCALRKAGVKIVSELELASQHVNVPLIAITGTNGKTTTTTLIGEIFKEAGHKVFVGGNIGTPLSEYDLSGIQADYLICEVSTFQLEGVEQFRPFISAVLNVTPDHLDRHADMKEYTGLKKRIFKNQGEGDFTVLNLDDPVTTAFTPPPGSGVHFFSRRREPENGAFLRGEELFIKQKGRTHRLCGQKEIAIRGVHNVENILAAATVASLCGIETAVIRSAVLRFRGIKDRMEFVAEVNGVTFINDSKGTNVGAAVRSVESVEAPVILIAGGRDKGGDYTPLKRVIREKVKSLVLIGEAGEKLASLVNGAPPKMTARSLSEAVNIAWQQSEKGDVVLLSPACSSFDMFRDYEERGECFRKAVERLQITDGSDGSDGSDRSDQSDQTDQTN